MPYTSKIINIRQETHDTKTFFFEKPENFNYKSGQYGIFEHKTESEIIRRSYSFSSSPTENHLAITVRLIPNGKMTSHLFNLNIGDTLTFNAPFGKFTMENKENVVFIGGGSGVTPFRSMIKCALDLKLNTKITLIYGARSPKDILFNDEFHSFLTNPNFKLFLTVDKPDETWKFHTGFIDSYFIKEATFNDLQNRDYFLCGPPIMLTNIKNALISLGVKEQNIILDAWG
ncbi:MAG: FAD-dependent oxidoreductase [Candidatus Woesearchaeota archaeon]